LIVAHCGTDMPGVMKDTDDQNITCRRKIVDAVRSIEKTSNAFAKFFVKCTGEGMLSKQPENTPQTLQIARRSPGPEGCLAIDANVSKIAPSRG